MQTMRSLVLCFILASVAHAADSTILRAHAFTLYGDPKYGPDFTHFDYVNPDAPKGGEIRLAAIGTYDNLNPFHPQGRGRLRLADALQPALHQV